MHHAYRPLFIDRLGPIAQHEAIVGVRGVHIANRGKLKSHVDQEVFMLRFALLTIAAVAIASCESCPTCPQELLVGGSFDTAMPGGAGNGTPAGTFPWDSSPKHLDIDVQQRVVRLSYTRDGHQIVETYRIASLTECPQ